MKIPLGLSFSQKKKCSLAFDLVKIPAWHLIKQGKMQTLPDDLTLFIFLSKTSIGYMNEFNTLDVKQHFQYILIDKEYKVKELTIEQVDKLAFPISIIPIEV